MIAAFLGRRWWLWIGAAALVAGLAGFGWWQMARAEALAEQLGAAKAAQAASAAELEALRGQIERGRAVSRAVEGLEAQRRSQIKRLPEVPAKPLNRELREAAAAVLRLYGEGEE